MQPGEEVQRGEHDNDLYVELSKKAPPALTGEKNSSARSVGSWLQGMGEADFRGEPSHCLRKFLSFPFSGRNLNSFWRETETGSNEDSLYDRTGNRTWSCEPKSIGMAFVL